MVIVAPLLGSGTDGGEVTGLSSPPDTMQNVGNQR